MSRELSVFERCWCWQYGRCLAMPCPTADHPKPHPMTDANWRRAWDELRVGAAAVQGESEEEKR